MSGARIRRDDRLAVLDHVAGWIAALRSQGLAPPFRVKGVVESYSGERYSVSLVVVREDDNGQ